MNLLANIMWSGVVIMTIGTIYIFWKNKDIFHYEIK